MTSEKKNVDVDYYIVWRIADTQAFIRATGGQQLVAADRLSSIVNRGLRDQFGSLTIQQAVSDERDSITTKVIEQASRNVIELGIEVADVRVKRIDLPRGVSESVFDRMRAERLRVASDLRARGAEEGERIRADVDREAQVLLAEAYREAETLRGKVMPKRRMCTPRPSVPTVIFTTFTGRSTFIATASTARMTCWCWSLKASSSSISTRRGNAATSWIGSNCCGRSRSC